MAVRPAKTQISLGICPVWSESSLSAWRNLGSLATHWAHGKDSDQTGLMPRLIWVFAGRTLILLVLSCIGSYYDSNLIWLTVSRQVDELISKDHMRCKAWRVIGWCETIQESWSDTSDQINTVIICSFNIWARPWENVFYAICEQQRRRSASSFCNQNFKPPARFCSWAGQFDSDLVGNFRRHVFSWRGSYIFSCLHFAEFCLIMLKISDYLTLRSLFWHLQSLTSHFLFHSNKWGLIMLLHELETGVS